MIILDKAGSDPLSRAARPVLEIEDPVVLREASLVEVSRMIRQIGLEQSHRANVGHIGSALSVADILAALYFDALEIASPADSERDRFVLSKGHAALALYAAFHLRGWLPKSQLDSYCGDGTLLGVHPERALTGVDFCTGSLGHGLPTAAGAALAARMQGSSRRVFVLVSDAECNEGSVWEAAMFAAHHRLGNLTVIVDLNGQQAFGYTRDVVDLSPMSGRWRAFGWEAHDVDGHDPDAMARTIEAPSPSGRPRVLVAHTIFGKGVSFMEGQIRWHYLPMSEEQYAVARREVARG
jgi:transketolase